MVTIGRYEFNGPYDSADELEPAAGVFAVLAAAEAEPTILDVGHADDVRGRIEDHEHRAVWEDLAAGSVRFAAVYTHRIVPEGREVIEREIRNNFDVPCEPAEESD